MDPGVTFPQQFFAMSKVLPAGRVVLVGGLCPLKGSRSAYRASVACYDYRQAKTVWLWEQTKCYPFRRVACTREAAGAMLDQSFVRDPIGLFRFDLASGQLLQPSGGDEGWNILHVDATEESLLFSRVNQDVSYVRGVNGRDGTFQERSFPLPTSKDLKRIERVLAMDDRSFIAVFTLVSGNRVVRSIERWDWQSSAPMWKLGSKLSHVIHNGPVLLLWDSQTPQLDAGLIEIESGGARAAFRLPLANVVSIRPVDEQTYAVLSLTGIDLLDIKMQRLSRLIDLGEEDFLDFGELAVDTVERKLVYLTAGNHMQPRSVVRVLDY